MAAVYEVYKVSQSYHIPEERVENDGDHSDTKVGVVKVDVF